MNIEYLSYCCEIIFFEVFGKELFSAFFYVE